MFHRNSQSHNITDTYYISQSYFHVPKNAIRKNCKLNILFKQTLRDVILLFHDLAGLDMNLQERKSLCRDVWENDYDDLQRDRFTKKEKVDTLLEIVLKVLF